MLRVRLDLQQNYCKSIIRRSIINLRGVLEVQKPDFYNGIIYVITLGL